MSPPAVFGAFSRAQQTTSCPSSDTRDAKQNRKKNWSREILGARRWVGQCAAIFSLAVFFFRVTHDWLSERETSRSLRAQLKKNKAGRHFGELSVLSTEYSNERGKCNEFRSTEIAFLSVLDDFNEQLIFSENFILNGEEWTISLWIFKSVFSVSSSNSLLNSGLEWVSEGWLKDLFSSQ